MNSQPKGSDMKSPVTSTPALVLGLLLSACATAEQTPPQASPSGVVTEDRGATNAQGRVGDKVTVEYYEGLFAEIAAPGAPLDEIKSAGAVARAPLGERPAGAVGQATTATVVIEYVDPIRNVVHFKGPLGKTRIVKVTKPEFRSMLKTLKPGDQVTLTYFEAMAVSVKPASD